MSIRRFHRYVLVAGLLLALLSPGGWAVPDARAWAAGRPALPLAGDGPPAGSGEMGAAQSEGVWRTYTNGNFVNDLAVEGDYVWAATTGGVVRWNRNDGSYVKYTTVDGLADNDVEAIAIDGAGHKWFGTYDGGVSEFDGVTWTTYTEADGLADDSVWAIAIGGAGHKWFGTWGGGVSEFDGVNWNTYTTADGLADNYVRAVAVDGAGHKWFGTWSGGVSEFDGVTWGTYTEADGLADNRVRTIAIDGAGHKWFGTWGGGVSEFDGATWTTRTKADGLADNEVRAIGIDGAGHKWFGTYYGVSVFDGATWTTYTTADGLADNGVCTIAVDDVGHKWFGTDGGGVSEFDGDTWTTYTTADGLAHNDIEAVAVDGAGHKWFGTYDGGVSKFDGATWTTYTEADGLADDSVWAIAIDGAGHKWFGTWGGGVSEFDGVTWATYTTADGLAGDEVRAIAIGGAGHKWFGTWGGGVSEFDGATWTTYTTADGLADNHVRTIAIDGAGHKWFGTWGGGVSEFDGSTWTTYTSAEGLPDNRVRAIAIDGAGHKWFGTYGGVSEFDGATWTTYTTAHGLASNGVCAIAVDGAGHKWFGTDGGGVSEFDGATWTTHTSADGLAHNQVWAIAIDGAGHKWFGTYGGVSELIEAPSAPTLYAVSNPDRDGDYAVDWSDVTGASAYTLQEDDNAAFTSPVARYSGGDSRYVVSGQPAGTWHYRVKASNVAGNSPWSNVASVTVGPSEGDAYEEDGACAQAGVIATDGTVQVHSFHQYADADWVTFDAVAGTTYLIEARIPADSAADVMVELYDQCAGLPVDGQDHSFSPGVRLEFEAPTGGLYYLKLLNHTASVYGADVAYHVSVRALGEEATPGALVLVAGRLRENDAVQDNIHHVTDAVRRLFMAHGYGDERIYYLATDTGREGVDALATAASLRAAITTWARDKVGSERAFTLYMMDHGGYDQFYLDKPRGEWVNPQEVDGWLDELEAAAPGVKVNVVIDACHSGSFIDPAKSVSGSGRVVMASTGAHALAWASQEGAIFSDQLITALGAGGSLYGGFQSALWAAQAAYPGQTPWIDDDGDGVANESADGEDAARRGFAFAGTLPGEEWPPYVVQGMEPSKIDQGQGVIRAEVRDDEGVKRVWAVIYAPSYQAPETDDELVREMLPTIVLLDQGGDWYGATYTGFNEVGVYRVVIHAEDDDGREARPLAVEVWTGWQVYLPLVLR